MWAPFLPMAAAYLAHCGVVSNRELLSLGRFQLFAFLSSTRSSLCRKTRWNLVA
jgi:hypothetical protein